MYGTSTPSFPGKDNYLQHGKRGKQEEQLNLQFHSENLYFSKQQQH